MKVLSALPIARPSAIQRDRRTNSPRYRLMEGESVEKVVMAKCRCAGSAPM
jgi:hypothetical protein